MVQLRTLKLIAAYGGVFCIGSALYFQTRIQDDFRRTEYYKRSLAILRQNRAVVNIMGEPIKDRRIDLGDSQNYVDGLVAQLAIPLSAPKEKGTLYLFANRETHQDSWTIQRLELELKKDPNQRLLVYKTNDADNSTKESH